MFDKNYLKYYLKSKTVQQFISGALASSVQQDLTHKSFKHCPIIIPPLIEQQRISHILSNLDDKIELNRRMNKTLEAIARAIFKSWFVDFDPVRAKSEGREPAGMDAETAALFPDSFEETELGMVPKGWKERTLSEFAVLNPEVWTRDTAPDQIEYIDLSNTKRGIIESTIKHQWKDAPSRARRILRAGDSILGTVRPGNESYALISEEVLTGSTGFAVLRPVKREFRDYVYLAATAPANIERLSNLADGAAYPAVSPEMIMSTQVVKIPDPIIKRFSHLTCPLLDRFAANCKESSTLATLRDVLLPMLISGKIRTNDVEDFLRERDVHEQDR